jgi:hypothetical protein
LVADIVTFVFNKSAALASLRAAGLSPCTDLQSASTPATTTTVPVAATNLGASAPVPSSSAGQASASGCPVASTTAITCFESYESGITFLSTPVAQTTPDSDTTLCYVYTVTCASADLVSMPGTCTRVGQTYLVHGTSTARDCAVVTSNTANQNFMHCNTANCNTAARFAAAQAAAASPAAKLVVSPCVLLLALVVAGVTALA